MANVGFYSRHLTDEDVDQIGAATRSLINKGAGQVKFPFLILRLKKYTVAYKLSLYIGQPWPHFQVKIW